MTQHVTPLQRVQTSFERQGLMRHWGAQIERVEHGLCVLSLPYSDKVTQQQDGFAANADGRAQDLLNFQVHPT